MHASLSAVARHFLFVRETLGPNLGYAVEFFQRFAGGVPGESWCADFESFVEAWAYRGGKAPLPVTGSTQEKLEYVRAKHPDWIVATPAVDDVFFRVNSAGVPHHIGFVTGVAPLIGIAGNTSEDGTSSNGTGVFEHTLVGDPSTFVFVRLPA